MRALLVQAAHGAKLKRGTFYRAKYNKLVFKLGSANKAKVAIANRLARAIYLILGGETYRELGYMRGDPQEQKIAKLIGQLRAMGVDIKHVNHQIIVSDRKITVEKTGIILE
jgi:hypothetical protein